MKHLLLTILAMAIAVQMQAQLESTPAFPGAEGHGRFVTGGRGGKIVHVTNLKDGGSGSFREAVKGSDKKIVVFDVGGVIALSSAINIGDNTTIEGQTAPAPGITLRYYTVNPGGNNIIRFIRFRRGQEKDINDGADASTQRHKTGIIFDHCSLSWSIDEVASFYDNNNFTMQWCTIAESLTNAGHGKGAHGYGGIWGGKLASFHHNLIAHVTNRGPRFNGARYGWDGYTSNYDYSKYKWANPVQAENVDFRNCVMYNAQGTCYGGPGGGQINMVNNYYKAGPCGNGNQERVTLVTVSSSGNSDTSHPEYYGMTSRYYISGNTTETTSGNVIENKDWAGVSYDSGTIVVGGWNYSKDPNNFYPADVPSTTSGGVRYVRIKMDDPCPAGYVTTHTAENAFSKVLAYVGASLDRDPVDARYVKEATDGTAMYRGSVTGKYGLIDVVADVEGYTENNFGTSSRPAGYDTDKDGMPDEWEIAWGLNPNDASDAKTYTMDEKHIYTNLEMYCNSIVENIMKGGVADAEDTVEEYWPELRVIKPETPDTPDTPSGENVSFILSAKTATTNSSSSYDFHTNGYDVSITNTKSKGYATGKSDCIKYSVGVQYTITLPKNFVATEVEFYGYDNYAEEAYLAEVCGANYGASDYVFPGKNNDNPVYVTNKVPVKAAGTITFTPASKQLVLSITVSGSFNTGIENVAHVSASKPQNRYNLSGQRVANNYKGITIIDGKKVAM